MTDSDQRPEAMPTVDLLALARDGHADAANTLWARYGQRVTSIVRIRLGARLRGLLESTDIRQQVLLEAFDRLEGFEMHDDSSLMRWLARFVENAIRTEARHWHVEKRDQDRVGPLPTTGEGEDTAAGTIDLAGLLPTPSVEVGRSERVEAVREAIADLPERYREVILLRDYEQCSWEEVGREMKGITANAAGVLHSRAVAKLGKLLRERGIE